MFIIRSFYSLLNSAKRSAEPPDGCIWISTLVFGPKKVELILFFLLTIASNVFSIRDLKVTFAYQTP